MIVIVCTGTPGTGKTALAKKLANDLKYDYVDVNKVIDDNKLIEEYDEKRNTYVVDEEKLSKILIIMIESGKNLVIDSHLAHYVPKANVDYCIVLKCDIKDLKERLERRKYSVEKIKENVDAEIFDVCLNEALEFEHNIFIFDSSKLSVKEIIKKFKNETSLN
ncbi:MAG: adenylate kinase family protein [archaeon]